MRVLVLDIGGTAIKLGLSGSSRRARIRSGAELTPRKMVEAVRAETGRWRFDAISIGYPGPVRQGRPVREPEHLGRGWVGFDFAAAFGKPTQLVNDAAMQALGCYGGGRMLFLGLGTGLGSALVTNGVLEPLELAHLPYRHGRSYEEYLGKAGLHRLGRKRWAHHVQQVALLLQRGLLADYVALGGGNVKKLSRLPPGARRAGNADAIAGGIRLWQPPQLTLTRGKSAGAPRSRRA
jgi:hypothetical protein